jgi:hypothetical protein
MQIEAPWTDEFIEALSAWQRAGFVHEYTCGNDHPGDRTLYPTREGWRCTSCSYKQTWAHNTTIEELRAQRKRLLDRFGMELPEL